MARRGRGAENLDGDRPIELIDPIPPSRPTSEFEAPDDDRPRPEPAASHSRLIGLAAALVAAVAVWTLAVSRNDAASPPTTEPAPVEEPEPGIAAPRIGAGPELRWERIMWNIQAGVSSQYSCYVEHAVGGPDSSCHLAPYWIS